MDNDNGGSDGRWLWGGGQWALMVASARQWRLMVAVVVGAAVMDDGEAVVRQQQQR